MTDSAIRRTLGIQRQYSINVAGIACNETSQITGRGSVAPTFEPQYPHFQPPLYTQNPQNLNKQKILQQQSSFTLSPSEPCTQSFSCISPSLGGYSAGSFEAAGNLKSSSQGHYLQQVANEYSTVLSSEKISDEKHGTMHYLSVVESNYPPTSSNTAIGCAHYICQALVKRSKDFMVVANQTLSQPVFRMVDAEVEAITQRLPLVGCV
ncbi:unnamed protein product [Protopolystoma xenopodis]|uniref:Uncharacterized protein n=1 Tax=Protopolystoma xenopodis TaxID=117903 RepID=A0A3S5BLW3_9PLAT|nr:unnamed protein product [Protopolystoma xenopodis]